MGKGKNLIIAAVILFLILFVFLYYTVYLPEKRAIIREEPVREKTFEDFWGSPIISGSFVEMDFENNLLYLETYDSNRRKDIIVSVQTTEKTIFKKTSRQSKDYLIIEDYSEALNLLSKGAPLKVFVPDLSEEKPEAFVVEIDVDFPFFPQPTIMESL